MRFLWMSRLPKCVQVLFAIVKVNGLEDLATHADNNIEAFRPPVHHIAETINLETLNLGFRRDFTWRFVIADVSKPIIRADFLSFYNLKVDIRNQRLLDGTTRLTIRAEVAECAIPEVNTVNRSSRYHDLLIQGAPGHIRHNTKHHIKTTQGSPVASRPRRQASENFMAAKKEFEAMLRLGIARPSKSPWSAPLHLAPKKGFEEWRP